MTKHAHTKLGWSYSSINDRIPNSVSGVYAFWCRASGKCIYVGKAEKQPIKARLRAHRDGSHNETLKLWIGALGGDLDICYKSAPPQQIDRLERRLIKMWRPKANKQHNR